MDRLRPNNEGIIITGITTWLDDLPALLGYETPIVIVPATMAIIVGVAAILCVPRATWAYFGLFTTLVHELGHAFTALLSGRRVTAIHLHLNHAGSAHSVGRGTLGTVISGFFGYPAPAIVGAAVLWAVFSGYTAAAVAASTVIIAGTLLFIRNGFGVVVVLVSAVASGALWYFGSAPVQSYTLLVVGVSLMIGSVRALLGVIAVHTTRRANLASSDAYLLFKRTGIPSPVWLLLFVAVIAASLYFAATQYLSTVALPLSS